MKIIRQLFHFFITYIKRPIFYRFFVLRWEIFRKPPFHFDYYGYKVYYQPKDGLVYHVGGMGSFEKDVIDCCLKNLPIDALIFDIGANIGLITLALARLLPQSTFHCFEPSPYPYKYFAKTIKENNLGGRIKLNKIGLYEKEGSMKFYLHDYKDASGDGLKDTYRAGKTRPVHIDVTTLDKYVKDNSVKNISLIKIDIEGAELSAFKGGVKTIGKFSPKIMFEAWHENLKAYHLKAQEIHHFFQKINYRIYSLKGKLLDELMFAKATTMEGNFQAVPV